MNKVVKIIFVVGVLLAGNNLVYSQAVTWQRLYDGPYHFSDAAYDVCQTKDSNFIVVGYTNVLHSALYILKINGKGDTIWTKSIGGYLPGQLALSVTSSSDGGCVLTGDADTSFAIKLNANGSVSWHKRYKNRYVQCYAICNTLDGGFIACGRVLGIGGYVFKIDSLGNFEWEKIFPGEFTSFSSVELAHNSGFILSGTVYDTPTFDTVQALVVRIDESGNPIWQKRYTILKECNGAIILLSDKGYLLSGNASSQRAFEKNLKFQIGSKKKFVDDVAYFIKLDSNGNQLYSKVFDSNTREYLGDFKIINNNRYLICLGADSGNITNGKLLITDSTGSIVNEKVYQSTRYLYIESSVITYTKDYVFAGSWGFYGAGNRSDIYVLRTDSNLYAPPIVSINANETTLPTKHLLHPSYPNPFNSEAIIKYELGNTSLISLKIFNIQGKEVQEAENGEKRSGIHVVRWNGITFNSGIYYCTLFVDKKLVKTIKIVLLK